MGTRQFSCEDLSFPELRALLEAIRDNPSPPAVALLGENNNLLGLGFVTGVGDGTVSVDFSVATIGISTFNVNLCCVCSIVEAPTDAALLALLRLLGIIP